MASLWLTTHALYNAGHRVGRWFDHWETSDMEAVLADIRAIATDAGITTDAGEEIMVCDTEGFCGMDPTRFPVADWENIGGMCDFSPTEVALLVEAHGAHYYTDADHLQAAISDLNYYKSDTREDLAWEIVNQSGAFDDVPDSLRPYMDAEAWLRDAEMNGDFMIVEYEGEYYAILN